MIFQAAPGSPDFFVLQPLHQNTFEALVVDGLRVVARNCLCVSHLLNARAANGEHGELGSGWCTGSYAPPGS